MNNSTKNIVAVVVVAVALVLIFGFALPALISANSDMLVATGFALATTVVVAIVVFVRNLLGKS